MSLNTYTIQGRIPFDLELRNPEDEHKCNMQFAVAVRRETSDKDENGYTPEDLIYLKAFNSRAKMISTYFKKGDAFMATCRLETPKTYTNKDGVEVKPAFNQFDIIIEKVHFMDGAKNGKGEGTKAKATSAPKEAASGQSAKANPFKNKTAGGASNPFKPKK